MITVECPHCKMRIALGRGAARRIAEQVEREDFHWSDGLSVPPLTQPHLDLKAEVSEDDIGFLESLGIKP
jgi:hypothetical protein